MNATKLKGVRKTLGKTQEKSLNESFQKMKNLITDLDKLLSKQPYLSKKQPYLSKALEETSHFLYWDISEGDLWVKIFKRIKPRGNYLI